MSAQTVGITGASGMLGSALADHFRRSGWNVRALMRDPSFDPFREKGIERARFDLDRTVSPELLAGLDVLVHAAYTTRFTTLDAARRGNVDGTEKLLQAARSAAVKRMVFISSLAARADAPSYYGRSKFELEQRLTAPGDLIVRPGLIISRDGGLARRLQRAMARTHLMPLVGGGRQIVQTVHVADLCRAIERALVTEGRAFNVAEPDGVTMHDLLRLLAMAGGVRAIPLPLPAAPVLAGLRLLERLRVGFPISSENLLGLTGMRHVETRGDLARLGVSLRTARESIAALA